MTVDTSENNKPNVVLFMADSYMSHFMGTYGDQAGCTPNLDRLASKGIVFENAYCNAPLCAPSRASLTTGRFASEIGCYDNANEFASEWPTLGHVFKKAGYETSIIGKMHYFGYDQSHGFDKRIALDTDYTKGYDPGYYALAYDWEQPSGGNPMGGEWMGESYIQSKKWDNFTRHYDWDVAIHNKAIKYLSEKDPNSNPFFSIISYHQPHNPFWITKEIRDRFRGKPLQVPDMKRELKAQYNVMDRWLNEFHYVPETIDRISEEDNLRWLYENFYGMMFDVDQRIGELLDLMDKKGLTENTAIIFISDHGDMLGYRGMIQKRCFYDKSVKVPFIFSFPGKWKSGSRISGSVSLVDLLPTLADIAGVEPPDNLPGKNLLQNIASGQEPDNKIVFSEYHGEGVHAPCFMALKGTYKYVYVHGYDECLYDLEEDPGEYKNVIEDKKYSQVREELKSALLQQFNPDAIASRALQSQKNRKFIYKSEIKT